MAYSTDTTTTSTPSTRGTRCEEVIYSYPDGSVYMGHMLDGKKHGTGTLRTAAFIYGAMVSSSSAEDNAHLAKWNEYIGDWENDVMHGKGKHVMMNGAGGSNVIYEGIWDNGKPLLNPGNDYFAD